MLYLPDGSNVNPGAAPGCFLAIERVLGVVYSSLIVKKVQIFSDRLLIFIFFKSDFPPSPISFLKVWKQGFLRHASQWPLTFFLWLEEGDAKRATPVRGDRRPLKPPLSYFCFKSLCMQNQNVKRQQA